MQRSIWCHELLDGKTAPMEKAVRFGSRHNSSMTLESTQRKQQSATVFKASSSNDIWPMQQFHQMALIVVFVTGSLKAPRISLSDLVKRVDETLLFQFIVIDVQTTVV